MTIRNGRTVLVLLAVLAAPPAFAAEPGACTQARSATLRISACSAVIADKTATPETRAAAYRIRGTARADAGAVDQALADLTEAIRLAPGDVHAISTRGHVRLMRSDAAGAIADFDMAIRLAPNAAAHWIARGHARVIANDAQGAIADLTEAVRLNPKSASAYNNRGLAWRKAGDTEHAVADYAAAIAINPNYALAYNNRGYAHEAAGRTVDAIADFNRALLLDPSLTGASDGLRRLKAPAELARGSDFLIREGKAIAESNCSRCHAVGPAGESANPKAPPFRTLQQRHAVQALREPLSRGIAAPHDEMPQFRFREGDVDKIVAYVNSLSRSRR